MKIKTASDIFIISIGSESLFDEACVKEKREKVNIQP